MGRPKGSKNKPKDGIAIVSLVPETPVVPAAPAPVPVIIPPVVETPAPVAPVVETPPVPAPIPTPPVETPPVTAPAPVEEVKETVDAPKTETPAETEDAETSKRRGRKPKEEPVEKKDQLPSGARGILIDSVRLAACIKACKGITTSELNAGLIQNLVSLAQASGTDELKARIQKSSEEYSE